MINNNISKPLCRTHTIRHNPPAPINHSGCIQLLEIVTLNNRMRSEYKIKQVRAWGRYNVVPEVYMGTSRSAISTIRQQHVLDTKSSSSEYGPAKDKDVRPPRLCPLELVRHWPNCLKSLTRHYGTRKLKQEHPYQPSSPGKQQNIACLHTQPLEQNQANCTWY